MKDSTPNAKDKQPGQSREERFREFLPPFSEREALMDAAAYEATLS